jgi:hypothetical protein
MTNPTEQVLLDALGALLVAARLVRAVQLPYLQNAHYHGTQIRERYTVVAGEIYAAIAVDGTITVADM